MKFSVVTVCFNSATTIADTLRSVAMQTYPEVEHIVVDGASRDATMEVVRRDGSHVAQFVSEPDNGIYDAMNKGLSMATGDVVAHSSTPTTAMPTPACCRTWPQRLRPKVAITSTVISGWSTRPVGSFANGELGQCHLRASQARRSRTPRCSFAAHCSSASRRLLTLVI